MVPVPTAGTTGGAFSAVGAEIEEDILTPIGEGIADFTGIGDAFEDTVSSWFNFA